jgi:glutaredoxin 3
MNTDKPLVLMYARQGCGYCTRARQLLARKGIAYTEVDIETVAGARAEMQQRSGRSTVPQVFVGDRHLGGYDDISALDDAGELDPVLAATAQHA